MNTCQAEGCTAEAAGLWTLKLARSGVEAKVSVALCQPHVALVNASIGGKRTLEVPRKRWYHR